MGIPRAERREERGEERREETADVVGNFEAPFHDVTL